MAILTRGVGPIKGVSSGVRAEGTNSGRAAIRLYEGDEAEDRSGGDQGLSPEPRFKRSYATLDHGLLADPEIAPTHKVIVMALSKYGWRDGTCYPSVATIAKTAGLCTRTVRRALPQMVAAGLIHLVEADDNPTGRRIELLWLAPGFRRPMVQKGKVPACLSGGTGRVSGADRLSDCLTGTDCPEPPARVSAEVSFLKKPIEETTTTSASAPVPPVVVSSSLSFVASPGNPEAGDSAEMAAAIAKAQVVFGAEDAERVAGCVRAAAREHPVVWIIEAVELAAHKGKGWGFVVVILKNWKSQGCPSPRTVAAAPRPGRDQEQRNSADDRKSVPGADAVSDMVARTLTQWRAADGDNDALNDYYRSKMNSCAETYIQRHGAMWDRDERESFQRSVREAVEVRFDENRLAKRPVSSVSQLRCG